MTTVGSETRTKRANEALGVNVKDIIVDSRINKVLEMRTDTVAMLEALDAISEFYVSNTVEARRALRQDLELQNITLAKKFLSEYDQVCDRFEHVVSMSQQLDSTCAAVNAKVSEADINMKAFMEKASELENKRNFFMEQSQAIGMFLSKFQLSSDEVDALYRAPICPQSQPSNANMKSSKNLFFDALQRLRLAYADCKAMVEKHCYSAGFELLEVLGKHQDRAYQRLFEWVKKQCDEIAESGEKHSEEIDTMLQTAVKYLRQLPVYYAQCQDLIISARRTQLVQKFVMALTQGGPNVGSVFRAIDLHASDSPRYVADMLAWMHQSIAGEEEFLESIFGNKQPTAATAPSTEQSPPSESPPSNSAAPLQGLTVPELLAACLQGLGRPLRVRLSQTLETRQTVDSLYLIVDLLGFYEVTFQKIVQVENAVHSTVRGSLLECTRLLSIALQKQGEALLTTPPSYPLDLSVCLATKECARQIRGCLAVQNQALSTIPSDVDAANAYHADVVINAIIQPLLQACRMGGQALPQSDMAVFMLNNVAVLQVSVCFVR